MFFSFSFFDVVVVLFRVYNELVAHHANQHPEQSGGAAGAIRQNGFTHPSQYRTGTSGRRFPLRSRHRVGSTVHQLPEPLQLHQRQERDLQN